MWFILIWHVPLQNGPESRSNLKTKVKSQGGGQSCRLSSAFLTAVPLDFSPEDRWRWGLSAKHKADETHLSVFFGSDFSPRCLVIVNEPTSRGSPCRVCYQTWQRFAGFRYGRCTLLANQSHPGLRLLCAHGLWSLDRGWAPTADIQKLFSVGVFYIRISLVYWSSSSLSLPGTDRKINS